MIKIYACFLVYSFNLHQFPPYNLPALTYHHLTIKDRNRIERMLKAGYSQAAIARRLDVHRSTIKKELDRNSINGVYKAGTAQRLSGQRKKRKDTYLPRTAVLTDRENKNFRLLPSIGFESIHRQQYHYKPSFRFDPLFWPCPHRIRPNRKIKANRLSFEQQQYRAWLLSKRERSHLLESMAKTSRDWLDFRLYKRAAWCGMKFYKGRFKASTYHRKGPRTLLFAPLRLRYRKSIVTYKKALNTLSNYQPYPFTRFDWLFRKNNPAKQSTPSTGSRHYNSKKELSPANRSDKRSYKLPPLDSLELNPVSPLLPKARGVCPPLSEILPAIVSKRKKAFRKTPLSDKLYYTAYFFA